MYWERDSAALGSFLSVSWLTNVKGNHGGSNNYCYWYAQTKKSVIYYRGCQIGGLGPQV